MKISAHVICDSVNPKGDRLTTFVLTLPRIVLSEFNTHRMFSRNASSSRAIPVAKMIKQVVEEPFIPIHWGSNKPGMQAGEELDSETIEACKITWLEARDAAVDRAQRLLDYGLHKQTVNRLLESWMFTKIVLSATDYANFFALRDHPMAEPHIALLARDMREAYRASVPKLLDYGRWHLPFINQLEWEDFEEHGDDIQELIECSVARCARVSYLNHDGTHPSREKDKALHDQLCKSRPMHGSALEHAASSYDGGYLGNFKGWKQYRKYLADENITVLPWEQPA